MANYLDSLPIELLDKIIWMASGPINLEIYTKKRRIKEEIDYYRKIRTEMDETNLWHLSNCIKYGLDGVYLKKIGDYSKTPELYGCRLIFANTNNMGPIMKKSFALRK